MCRLKYIISIHTQGPIELQRFFGRTELLGEDHFPDSFTIIFCNLLPLRLLSAPSISDVVSSLWDSLCHYSPSQCLSRLSFDFYFSVLIASQYLDIVCRNDTRERLIVILPRKKASFLWSVLSCMTSQCMKCSTPISSFYHFLIPLSFDAQLVKWILGLLIVLQTRKPSHSSTNFSNFSLHHLPRSGPHLLSHSLQVIFSTTFIQAIFLTIFT